MKRILVLFAAAMLCASPCFAAGSSFQYSQSSGGNTKGGEQTNIINRADIRDTNAIAVDNSRVNMATVDNEGGKQSNVVNDVQLRNVNAIAVDKSEVNIGRVSNK